jgi:23S rRNA-/tRNA-specific pseudouridylate synthase
MQDHLPDQHAGKTAFVSIDPVPATGSSGGFIGQMANAKSTSGAALSAAMGGAGDRVHHTLPSGASASAKAFATSLALVHQANTRGQIHFFGPRMSEVAVDGARASRSGSLAATPVAVMLQSGLWGRSMELMRHLWPSREEALADSRNQQPAASAEGEEPGAAAAARTSEERAELLLARRQATALRGLATASLGSADPSLARALFAVSLRHLQLLRQSGGTSSEDEPRPGPELGDVVSLDQLPPLSCSVGHATLDSRLRQAAESTAEPEAIMATATALGIALPDAAADQEAANDAAASSLLLDTLSHTGPGPAVLLHLARLPEVPLVSVATAARLAATAARVSALPEHRTDTLFADLAAAAADGPNSRLIAVRVWAEDPGVLEAPWRAAEFKVLALGENSGHWLPGELLMDSTPGEGDAAALEAHAAGLPQVLSLASILAAGAGSSSAGGADLTSSTAAAPASEQTRSGSVAPSSAVRLLHGGPVSVLCKPPRMLSTLAVPAAIDPPGAQPTRRMRATVEGTIAAEGLWNDVDAPEPSRHGCGMLTRLDRGTSGLIPVACNAAALDGAVRGSHVGRSSSKEYIAICVGLPDGAPLAVPQTSSLLSPLEAEDVAVGGPGPWAPLVSVVDRLGLVQQQKGSDQAPTPRGAASLSRSRVDARVVKVLRSVPLTAVGLTSKRLKKKVDSVPIVVVRVRAETAKRHEVRQHLAACGYPILNDVTASLAAAVSTQVLPSARFALHATSTVLGNATPRHRHAIVEEALPSDLANVLRRAEEGVCTSSPSTDSGQSTTPA